MSRPADRKGFTVRARRTSPIRSTGAHKRATRGAAHSRSARRRRLPELVRDLFPGYHFGDLALPDHLDLVMLHVLTVGGPKQKGWLVRRFGDPEIRRWILRHRGRGLTVQQMTPWVSVRTARRWQAANPYARIWERR